MTTTFHSLSHLCGILNPCVYEGADWDRRNLDALTAAASNPNPNPLPPPHRPHWTEVRTTRIHCFGYFVLCQIRKLLLEMLRE